MGRYELQYPKDATNTVKRHDERASYALKSIHSLINTSPILHISFNTPHSPFPFTLPMLGQMGSFSRPSASESDPLDLYVHGYVSSRLMNLGRGADDEGLPVSVCASHVDGIVLAMSSFNHSYNYRSALLFGHAHLVTDEEEKLYAMEMITNGVVPDRWGHTRLPILPSELQSTSLLRICIVSGSAKVREGNASDDRHDMENDELRDGMWTGTLPVYQSIGEPVPSSYSKVDVPEHVRDFVEEFNKDSKDHAIKVAQVKKE